MDLVFTPTPTPKNRLRMPVGYKARRDAIPLAAPGERFMLQDLFVSWGINRVTAQEWLHQISQGLFVQEYLLFHKELTAQVPTKDRQLALRKLSRIQKDMLKTFVVNLEPRTELAPWPLKVPGVMPQSTSRSFESMRVRGMLLGFTRTATKVSAVSLTALGWVCYFEDQLKKTIGTTTPQFYPE